jgi:hypothetical protein
MSYEQSNVGPGMVPHRKGCRCDECEIDRLKARLAEAERKLQHCKEQADAGLEAEHDCPAVYACASIFAELATEADRAAVSAGEPRHQTPENTADSASVVTESK